AAIDGRASRPDDRRGRLAFAYGFPCGRGRHRPNQRGDTMKRSNRRIAALTTLGASLGLAASLAFAQQANWHPSKWGAKDEIGAANYLTAERAAAAAKLVKTGKVYSLGIEVTPDTPAFPPRGCKLYIVQPG